MKGIILDVIREIFPFCILGIILLSPVIFLILGTLEILSYKWVWISCGFLLILACLIECSGGTGDSSRCDTEMR